MRARSGACAARTDRSASAGAWCISSRRSPTTSWRTCDGYDGEYRSAVLALTYNYGVERYDLGSGFGHVAIEVPDIKKACERVKSQGGKITREPGPVKGGATVIAFAEDPDGYKIEFIERRA